MNEIKEIVSRHRCHIEAVEWSSYTLPAIEVLCFVLRFLQGRVNRMIDLGGGYGVLTKIVAEYVHTEEYWLADIDEERLRYISTNFPDVKIVKADISKSL